MSYRAEIDVNTKDMYVAVCEDNKVKQVYDMKQKIFVNPESVRFVFLKYFDMPTAHETILDVEEGFIPGYTGPTYTNTIKMYIDGKEVDSYDYGDDDLDVYGPNEAYKYKKFNNEITSITYSDGQTINFNTDYFKDWIRNNHPLISHEFPFNDGIYSDETISDD